MRVVLSDAGPLIGLARIQRLQLLRDLFATIWITEVIAAEIGLSADDCATPSFPERPMFQEACEQGWLRVVKPEWAGSAAWKPLNPGVDAGEASAIALAIQQRDAGHDVLLLIDDRCGRAEARRQGLFLIGTAAVLVLAKERKQGYYLSDGLIAAVLKQVGEAP